MKLIEEYILLPKTERQSHLKLSDPCLERGGQSMYLKGLLAHLRDTTIPAGYKIYVCHACHNAKCSNPDHLYWGTPSENAQDHIDNGGKNIWDKTVAKHGLEKAKQIMANNANPKLGGKNNTKPKSEEHKRKISESIKLNYAKNKARLGKR